jgi:transposase
MRRHELTDEQFARLEPYLPKGGPEGGHPWAEHRRLLNGLFWKLHTGAQWRDIPERYGPWTTIYDRYRRFCQEGRFACLLVVLRDTLDAQGLLDWEQWWLDSTSIRASRAAAGARKKGGQKTNPSIRLSAVPKVDLALSCICCAMDVACH